MDISSFIARRHLLGENKLGYISFISIISTIGLAIGVAALILTISSLNGFENKLKSKLVSFDSHIRLRLIYNEASDSSKQAKDKLNKYDQITSTVPYIHRNAIIRKGNSTDGIVVEGYNQEGINKSLDIEKYIKRGKLDFKTDENQNGIIIGGKLANYMDADTGDTVYLFRIDDRVTRQSKISKFTVTGIYSSGISEYDDIYVYTSIKALKDFYNTNNLSGYQISLKDPNDANKVAKKINNDIGFPYEAISWNKLHTNLFRWLEVQRFPIILAFGLIAAVALFNLISALTMIVIEKKKDIGILKSLGVNKSQIMKIFFKESLLIGGTGILIGFALAIILAWLQNTYGIISIPEDVYFMENLPIMLKVTDFLIIGGAALLASMSATLYPSFKAGSVLPAEEIKYE